MATQYNTEPQTTAKVILTTTSGELDVELWTGQAPVTSRAFLQLCLDGFYTNQPFSRLVPGFVVQLGDVDMDSPRRGAAEAEEVSSRLKFNRRGLLGAVRRDPSGFFVTLGSARELDGRATMFGKVVGETVYNVVKMGEAEVNGEVPVFPVKVVETRVVINPFEDMVARVPTAAEGTGETEKVRKKVGKKKDGKKGKGALLSFGEEEEGGEAEEVKFAKPKFDARLVVDRHGETHAKEAPPATGAPANPSSTTPIPTQSPPAKATPTTTSHHLPPPAPPKSQSQPQPQSQSQPHPPAPPQPKSNAPKRSLLAVQKSLLPKTSLPARKRKRTAASSSDDRTTLVALERFQQKLFTTSTSTTAATSTSSPPPQKILAENTTEADPYDEPRLCDLHFIPDCLSCTAFEPGLAEDDGDDGRAGIWGHELRFGKDFAGKDLEWRRKRLEETKGL